MNEMKLKLKTTAFLVGTLAGLNALAQPQLNTSILNPPSTGEPVPPDKEKLGYAIGMSVGQNISNFTKKQDVELNVDAVLEAVRDELTGKTPKMTEKEMNDLLRHDLQTYLQAKRQATIKKLDALGPQNKKEGEEFLAKNVTAEGVKTLTNGLQYKVIKEGTGESPASTDMVKVAYKGTLVDGTEFDSNDDFQTSLTRVIPGWTSALEHMKVGSKWRIFVPPDLAYGTRAQPPKIGPNSVLIFDMELLEVRHMPARPAFSSPMTPGSNAMHHTSTLSSTNGAVVSGPIIRVPSKAELEKGAKIEAIDPNSTNVAGANPPPPLPPTPK
jgi:FKBP-type peptidyl-prolyl cis-trans isomerase FklB